MVVKLSPQFWGSLRGSGFDSGVGAEVRVNGQFVDRIIYSTFQRFNLEWKNRTLRVFDITFKDELVEMAYRMA